ncbi:hypothetical protein PC113_g20534 [Phytophthora cactorum]|uniref:Uncharacterized protein n=1 Tax=Phytophthora cactorum TaxID=29920 RepID=A0A8T0YBF3_9STRA|nr:hypothetical protein PC113_g20534 [Phytophthora cactorum]
MIQQDNAKPHVFHHDADVVEAGMEGGFIPNRVPIHGIDNLITAGQAAYKDMSADTLAQSS